MTAKRLEVCGSGLIFQCASLHTRVCVPRFGKKEGGIRMKDNPRIIKCLLVVVVGAVKRLRPSLV